jgi:hypothetical protein
LLTCWPKSKTPGGQSASRIVVVFAILAIAARAKFYLMTVLPIIDVHLARLRNAFDVKWRKAPACGSRTALVVAILMAVKNPMRSGRSGRCLARLH